MRKFAILLSVLCAFAFAQNERKKLAIYIAGNVTEESLMLRTVINDAFINNSEYEIVEISKATLAALAKEQNRQTSGSVSPEKIAEMGKDSEAHYVCAVQIQSDKKGSHLLNIRIIDVTTKLAVPGKSNVIVSGLGNAKEILEAGREIAGFILGTPAQSGSAGKTAGGNTLTDPRGGQQYKTAKIGNQTWMAENLNYAASGSKCYGNNPANCEKYGRLYNWETAKKACPSGWHLPSDGEWEVLAEAVGGGEVAGKKLKAKSGWNTGSGYVPGTDDYGFSALPGGNGYSDGYFYYVGNYGFWWSATEYDSDYAWSRYMDYGSSDVGRDYGNKSGLFSVRCLQDYGEARR